MRFKEFQQVALAKDIPEKKLRRGDLVTIVDVHPKNGGEVGYSIEGAKREQATFLLIQLARLC